MNYTKIYENLINKGLERISPVGYHEKHHIIPRCLGGSDSKENLVNLTPEEHYVAHQLLVKIHPSNSKLVRATIMMCCGRRGNKLYGWLKRRFSKVQSERMKVAGPTHNKKWISNEYETVLIDANAALNLILEKKFIAGKVAIRAECGHLVKDICIPCRGAKRKSYDLKKENARILALSLFEEFKCSDCRSVGEFAIIKNTSQPRLSALWKRYVNEYNEKRQHGKSFLK
jgi:hypothetical protein